MDSERKKSFFRRKGWWLLIGAVVVYLAGFSLLEKLLPSGKGTTAAEGGAVSAPAPPELRRLEDGAIEIRQGLFQHLTIREGDKAKSDATFECLQQGFDETFGDGTEGWTSARVRSETRRVVDACVDLPQIPAPPRPRLPPREGS